MNRRLVSLGDQQVAFFPAHPPFSFEGEGTEGMQRGKINGRVPFGTWSSEMLRTVGRVSHTGGKRNPGCYSKGRERDGQRHGRIGAEGVCGKRVLPVGFLSSLSSCLSKNINEKGSWKEKL